MSAKDTAAKKHMTILQWPIASDKYATAAHATSQLDLCAAQSHKDVFLQLAVGASARGRRARVALVYDELVRRKWSDRSLSGDARLDIAQVAGVVDEAAFRQAEADFDARVRQPKVQAHKSWWSDADKGTYRQKGWGKWGNKRGNRQQDQEEDAQPKKRERH